MPIKTVALQLLTASNVKSVSTRPFSITDVRYFLPLKLLNVKIARKSPLKAATGLAIATRWIHCGL